MRKTIFYIALILSGLGIPLNIFGILNTMVSLKYETDNPRDCISLVTGTDLCELITRMKIWILICVLLITILLIFRKRLLKTNNSKPETK
ncbi:hypothetical protein [Xiashengella succiniciproducens]|uniref:Uncharacterized protein n=1 Tax=Xiashengella succiniciproducens TaxID=2949635 RepID=A0A9J6ZTL0_9BACT|nr:hypothetical protein [Alkaliflexus sp. Ai-910]URW80961.1 hypothetical protein M9189_06295 [Alkaliflexus sp. Ai-910]